MSLYNFLLGCKVDKGSESTHTAFMRPVGAFYVPSSQVDKFYELYSAAVAANEDLYVTERHRHIGPVLVDLDFRMKLDSRGDLRRYDERHIANIVRTYCEAICGLVHAPPSFDVYVQEKKRPVALADKGLLKDGIHMVIPGIVTRPLIQHILRTDVLDELADVLEDLELVNPIADVVDEAVIARNNWLMYGSKKPGGEPYKVTRVYRWNAETRDLTDATKEFENNADDVDLVELLSIRNKYDELATLPDRSREVELLEAAERQELARKEVRARIVSDKQDARANVTRDGLDRVSRIVDILKRERAERYEDWIRVGWCLRNIDHRLLDKWVEFSRSSPKYVEGECEKLWNAMRSTGLGIGTLHMWARGDAPEAYRELMKADMSRLLVASAASATHHDVARVVHAMYRHEYACANVRNKHWFEFRSHRWRASDCAYTLRLKMSTDVVAEYAAAADARRSDAAATEKERDQRDEEEKRLRQIVKLLKTVTFKNHVLSECSELFYHERFEEKLDSLCHLVGFENGVYDLDAEEFREGRPDDFVSFSTCVNYVPYDAMNPDVIALSTFWDQLFPNKAIREYVLRVLSLSIHGRIESERFHVWTGTGSNGKSKCVELFEKAFGDYCCKFPVSLLTQKRAASNSATSEVARGKGKRFVVLQEPSEDEKLNIGLMKELTGGDRIVTRKLYSEPIEFMPQWTIALLCNHLPNVPSDDGGTWRRIRVVEFTSKFVDKPDPEKPNEFPIDKDLNARFSVWREHFMAMLIDMYVRNKNKKLVEPEEVTMCTREYQRNNDHMADFADTMIVRTGQDADVVTTTEAFEAFKEWVRSDNIPIKVPKKSDLAAYIGKNLAKVVSVPERGSAIRGYVLRDRNAV